MVDRCLLLRPQFRWLRQSTAQQLFFASLPSSLCSCKFWPADTSLGTIIVAAPQVLNAKWAGKQSIEEVGSPREVRHIDCWRLLVYTLQWLNVRWRHGTNLVNCFQMCHNLPCAVIQLLFWKRRSSRKCFFLNHDRLPFEGPCCVLCFIINVWEVQHGTLSILMRCVMYYKFAMLLGYS